MDAVELLKGINRICEHHLNCDDGCPLKTWCVKNLCSLSEDPKKVIEVVEKWTNEHPVKTRQSEFLKMFPNARIRGDVLEIRPCDIDDNIECIDRDEECYECYRKYWLAEVE